MRIVVALVASLALSPAFATNLLSNGGFELPALGGGYTNYIAGSQAIAGWTVVDLTPGGDNEVSIVTNAAFGQAGVIAHAGNQMMDLTGVVGRGKGVVSNAVATEVGAHYRLNFALGEFYVAGQGSFGVAAVDLAINGVFQQQFVNPVSLTGPGSDWVMQQFDFTATSTSTRIQITNSQNLAHSNLGTGLDSVSLERVQAPVPEPQGWALMAAGLAGLGFITRRRRG
jgi:hypothetical protein